MGWIMQPIAGWMMDDQKKLIQTNHARFWTGIELYGSNFHAAESNGVRLTSLKIKIHRS